MRPTLTQRTSSHDTLLAVSLELSKGQWKIGLHDGQRMRPTVLTVNDAQPMARLKAALALVEAIRVKWDLPPHCRIAVVFEAGQDGLWIARALRQLGYEALPIDPASIPVERRARRAKTDRLDAIRLVQSLLGWLRGERDRMHVVQVPALEAEAERHRVRDRGQLQKEVQQHRDRLRKLLRTVGCWDAVDGDFATRLQQNAVRCYDGSPLPDPLRERLIRECLRWDLAQAQLTALEAGLQKALPESVQARVTQLCRLKAVGPVGAQRLMLELFWRQFDNRRQVGACVGLVPQPHDSGESRVDQGISKQGNGRVRALLIEMAWLWLRYQPKSALAQWFIRRTQGSGKRGRRIAIVAVARKLAIALWRYLQAGVIPEGAELKAA